MTDTIYALSSGRPPAAIAVVRVSGPRARETCRSIAGDIPPDRTASLRRLRDRAGASLDHALVLFFPGPNTATGEDLLELHLHGGRAVVAAVERQLGSMEGVRLAMAGEFTRRALENGRIDLTQAEGLADLLEAETEAQRRVALSASEGVLSRTVRDWLDRLSNMSARVEVTLDYSDEEDVTAESAYDPADEAAVVCDEMALLLTAPTVERLKDGPLVVIAGPPNVGKSSLFNALLQRDAAIVTELAGTTRDVLEQSVMREGLPFRLVDTAGLNEVTSDPVEQIGIGRAKDIVNQADLILWLGPVDEAPSGSLCVASKADLRSERPVGSDILVSSFRPASIVLLWDRITTATAHLMHVERDMGLHGHQKAKLVEAHDELRLSGSEVDMLAKAERLRVASRSLAAILGLDATSLMLDTLFGRFCLGK